MASPSGRGRTSTSTGIDLTAATAVARAAAQFKRENGNFGGPQDSEKAKNFARALNAAGVSRDVFGPIVRQLLENGSSQNLNAIIRQVQAAQQGSSRSPSPSHSPTRGETLTSGLNFRVMPTTRSNTAGNRTKAEIDADALEELRFYKSADTSDVRAALKSLLALHKAIVQHTAFFAKKPKGARVRLTYDASVRDKEGLVTERGAAGSVVFDENTKARAEALFAIGLSNFQYYLVACHKRIPPVGTTLEDRKQKDYMFGSVTIPYRFHSNITDWVAEENFADRLLGHSDDNFRTELRRAASTVPPRPRSSGDASDIEATKAWDAVSDSGAFAAANRLVGGDARASLLERGYALVGTVERLLGYTNAVNTKAYRTDAKIKGPGLKIEGIGGYNIATAAIKRNFGDKPAYFTLVPSTKGKDKVINDGNDSTFDVMAKKADPRYDPSLIEKRKKAAEKAGRKKTPSPVYAVGSADGFREADHKVITNYNGYSAGSKTKGTGFASAEEAEILNDPSVRQVMLREYRFVNGRFKEHKAALASRSASSAKPKTSIRTRLNASHAGTSGADF